MGAMHLSQHLYWIAGIARDSGQTPDEAFDTNVKVHNQSHPELHPLAIQMAKDANEIVFNARTLTDTPEDMTNHYKQACLVTYDATAKRLGIK